MNTALISIGHGWSDSTDAAAAGTAAAQEALTGVHGQRPSLVIVHASAHYALETLIGAIRQCLDPDIPLIGATSAGEYRDGLRQHGVLVTVLASVHLRAMIGVGRQATQHWEDAIDDAIGGPTIRPYFSNHPAHWRELTRKGSSVFGLVFSPGPGLRGPTRSFHILEALKARSQWQIPFVGGAAAEGERDQSSAVFANDQVIEDGLVIAVIETELRFGIGLSHGFQPTAHEMEVTASEANEIIELDHRPALEVFAELVGQPVGRLDQQHLTLRTGRGFGHAGSMGLYQLNAAGFATARRGIEVTRPVAPGTRLRLLEVDRDAHHVDTAADALRKAMMRAHHPRPAAAMMWYCALRPQLLPAELIDAELSTAAATLGDAPLLGCVSPGQHGMAQDGASAHYCGAVSVLLIGHELTPCARVARENEALRAEVAAHSAVLERSHHELEKLVAKRTADLKTANERLRAELIERNRMESASIARARLEVQEAALREHLQVQETLFDAIPVPVFHKDAFGRYTGCNSAFANFLRRDKRDIIGRTVFDIAQGALARNYRDRDLDLLDDPVGTQVYESPVTRADGEVRQVVFHKARITNADGRPVGIIGTILDITELKAAAEAREGALEEAQRLAQLRRDFLANMSHEIRSPLHVVLGLAQAGRRQNSGRKAEATFERILGAGQMLLALVNDILDFSKIESGKLSLEDEVFELGDVIDQAVTVVARQAFDKGLSLTVDEAPDLPMRCRGDALRLAQVLVNLLFNAVKFTEQGAVSLHAHRADDTLTLAVVDTGIGMTESQQSRLFNAFEQAESATTRRFGGTGLGLAITQRLVELMEGQISVTSAPGQGSRFDVRIPLRAVDERPLMPGRITSIGLGEAERQVLEDALRVRQIQLVAPFADDADPTQELVLVDAAAYRDPLTLEARSAGYPLALVCAPGVSDLPESWNEGVIERPLRARHVIHALQHRHDAPARVQSHRRLSGIRVLAVEDGEMNRIVLEELLGDEGARLELAEDGLMALDMLKDKGVDAFDIVLTDIQMPGIDGYETARRIGALAPSLPVIGLTAFAMPEERARCLASGMVDHVSKPIELDRLVSAILAQIPPDAVRPTTPGAPPMAPPQHPHDGSVDWSALHACFAGKPHVVEKLAQSFVRSQSATVERLQCALAACDLETLASVAHTLRGTAGHLRAGALQEAADLACHSAQEGQGDAIEMGQHMLNALERTLTDARAYHPDTH